MTLSQSNSSQRSVKSISNQDEGAFSRCTNTEFLGVEVEGTNAMFFCEVQLDILRERKRERESFNG